MKKLLCAVILWLCLPVLAFADSLPVSMSNEVVQAMLESSLENGFSHQKDLQAMLNNALLNGYDYSSVTYYESSNTFRVEVAIDGFSSAVTSLVNSKSDDAAKEIAQTKEAVISHYEAILDLFGMVGRDDINCFFKLLDDEMRESALVTITDPVDGDRRVVIRGIWSVTEQN